MVASGVSTRGHAFCLPARSDMPPYVVPSPCQRDKKPYMEIRRRFQEAVEAIKTGTPTEQALSCLQEQVLTVFQETRDRLVAGAAELSGLACAHHSREALDLGFERFAEVHGNLGCVWCLAEGRREGHT
jgi:hypothetical protein